MTGATAELEAQSGAENTEVENENTGPSYDDINVPVILMVGAISAIVTVCTIFFVQGLYYQWSNSYIRERSFDYVNEPVREIVEEQKALLGGDQEKGIKAVADTMKEVVSEFGK